jgi:hypothetical protein
MPADRSVVSPTTNAVDSPSRESRGDRLVGPARDDGERKLRKSMGGMNADALTDPDGHPLTSGESGCVGCRSSLIARSGPYRRRRKQPVLRQHFLKRRPLPQGHGSLRPSFSQSSLSPWTILRPRLTWVSLRVASTTFGHDLETRERRQRAVAWGTSSDTGLPINRWIPPREERQSRNRSGSLRREPKNQIVRVHGLNDAWR